jgi:thymidine kinase
MFAGKTTYLLNKVQAMLSLGFSCLFVNHEFDNRNSDSSISCHNKIVEKGLINLYLSLI